MARRLELIVLGDEVARLFHKRVDPAFIDQQALAVFEVRPNAAIAPERVIGLEFIDLLQQNLVTCNDGLIFMTFHQRA